MAAAGARMKADDPRHPNQQHRACAARARMRTARRLQVYHLPCSTNICLPPTSTIAYVSGGGWLCSDGLPPAAGAAAVSAEAAAGSVGAGMRYIGASKVK